MKKILKFSILLSFQVSLISLLLVGNASANTFDQNRIIDDAVFNRTSAMSTSSINSFLNGFPSSCISPNNGFSAPDPTGYNPTNGFQFGGNVTAGQVIYDAASAYNINPQVLITTLQKEQSLVDGSAGCSVLRYAAAAGYGCPDGGTTYNYSGVDLYTINGTTVTSVTGTCVNTSLKVGFSQQVIRAAWLLEFGMQRSEGNMGWDIQKTNSPEPGDNWDNSDDPQSCYGGPMTQGTWLRCPSGATAYYDGYTTIDGTSVHMDNGSTASLYWYTPHFPGNENFFNIFTNWFGNTLLPVAFKTTTSGTVYLQTNGYKFSVPSMALLQDYGIEPSAIQTVDQTTADNVPVPDSTTGYSTGLSYIVKSPSDTDSDGATVYLISAGKRYEITSMTQFSDFGYNTVNISYLPLSFIYSITDGGPLSNYITTPTQNVFRVSGGTKQIILNYQTYQSLNPNGTASFVSSYSASLTPSSTPLTNSDALIGVSTGTVYWYDNGNYYTVPSMDVYNCWGFTQVLGTLFYKLADDSYIGPINSAPVLGCSINIGQANYLLNSTNKISIPTSFGFTAQASDQNLANLASSIPTRSTSLGTVVSEPGSPTDWYIENGVRKPIPTLTDLALLGYSTSQIDITSAAAINSIPAEGIKLGTGSVIKTPNSGTIYATTASGTITPFASSDDFMAYNYGWPSVETIPSSQLNLDYGEGSSDVSKYLYDQRTNAVYLMDMNGCYPLTSSQLKSYGQDQNTIQTNQNYLSSVFPNLNLNVCKTASTYVKSPSKGTVYWIDNGNKYPFSSWSSLVTKSGTTTPYIIPLSDSTLATFPTGNSI